MRELCGAMFFLIVLVPVAFVVAWLVDRALGAIGVPDAVTPVVSFVVMFLVGFFGRQAWDSMRRGGS